MLLLLLLLLLLLFFVRSNCLAESAARRGQRDCQRQDSAESRIDRCAHEKRWPVSCRAARSAPSFARSRAPHVSRRRLAFCNFVVQRPTLMRRFARAVSSLTRSLIALRFASSRALFCAQCGGARDAHDRRRQPALGDARRAARRRGRARQGARRRGALPQAPPKQEPEAACRCVW